MPNSSEAKAKAKTRRQHSGRGSAEAAEQGANTQQGIQSVEIGMRLMKALVEHAFDDEPPMLKTIARDAGMPAGKAHRYMVSLLRCELVGRDVLNGRYTLGPLARLIGLRALQSVDVIRLANLKLPAVASRLRQTVSLAIWYPGQGSTIVAVEEWHELITIGTRIGRVMSMVDSAVGQIFGAWLPWEETEPLVRAHLEHLRRERSGVPTRAFITTTAQVRDLSSVRSPAWEQPSTTSSLRL